MSDYPIEGLMNTAMNSIKQMIDVNTIIGEPIETSSNIVVIPVSKVNFGFAAGGSEFTGKINEKNKDENNDLIRRMPFGGGSGAGVSISPVAFIVIQSSGVKLLPIEHTSAVDKLLDLVPDLIDKTIEMVEKQTKKIEESSQTFQYKYEKPVSNQKSNNVSNNNVSSSNASTNSSIKNNPSEVTKVESKPYDIEYDETDM